MKAFLKGMICAYWLMRDQPKNFDYVSRLERRLRIGSADAEERGVKVTCDDPRRCAEMPFPLDGLPTGFEELLAEEKASGDLNYDVPAIADVCALDLVKEAFAELMADPVTRAEYERVLPVAESHGY